MGSPELWIPAGTWAAWVGSVGTIGALGIALTLFWNGQGDNRKAQARQVTAWVEADFSEPVPGDDSLMRHRLKLYVSNASHECVYGIRVGIWATMSRGTGEVERFTRVKNILVVPPTTGEPTAIPVDIWFAEFPSDNTFLVAMRFRDSAYRYWEREPAGNLQRVHRGSALTRVRDRLGESWNAFTSWTTGSPDLTITWDDKPEDGTWPDDLEGQVRWFIAHTHDVKLMREHFESDSKHYPNAL